VSRDEAKEAKMKAVRKEVRKSEENGNKERTDKNMNLKSAT